MHPLILPFMQELYGNLDNVEVPDLSSPRVLNGIRISEEADRSSSSGFFGKFSGFITKTRSVVPSAK